MSIYLKRAAPDRSKDKLANAMSNMAIGGGQETRLDASTVVQEVLEKLDLVVEHVSLEIDSILQSSN